jgi:Tol biopolymer transport system component
MRRTTGKALTVSACTVFGALIMLSACATQQSRTLPFPERTVADGSAEAEIAYVGVDRRVYVTDRTGAWSAPVTQVPNVSTSELLFDMPTWSPDGDRLAFVGFDSTEDSEGRSTIYVADFADRRMHTSYVSIDNSPVVSG